VPNIPKALHFIWMGKDLPKKYIRNIAFWAARNRDYSVNIWTDKPMTITRAMTTHDDIRQFPHRVRLFSELAGVSKAHRSIIAREMNGPYNNLAAASDVLRLLILYTEGGVYLDTDVECATGGGIGALNLLPSLGQLRSHHGFLVVAGNPGNHTVPQNAVMASVAGNAYVRRILRKIRKNYRDGFMGPEDSWVAKRIPARADDAHAHRRTLTIGMSGPSAVEEVLAENQLLTMPGRVINAHIRFPAACVRVPCDKNWLGIGTYRAAEWP
jgi:hypothetical protein